MTPPRRLTGWLAAALLALALAAGLWLALRTWPASTATACNFARPQPPGAVTFAPTGEPPTAGPTVPPATVAPTEALDATEIAAAKQVVAIETEAAVRATQSPFPTAQPVAVQTSQPALLVAHRGGLTLQVRLPKGAYLNGETAWAEAMLSNAGPETLYVQNDSLHFGTTLLDAHGQQPPPWPWPWAPFGISSRPPGLPYLVPLAAGQSVTSTLVFPVAGPAPEYDLWVETQFSREPATLPGGVIWLRLDAGPLPLRVLAPAPSQKLQPQLQADRLTWSLRVTDAAGQVPAGPFVGQLESASANASGSRPLDSRLGGVWEMGWGDQAFGPGPFMVRAWVAAPGYVAAVVTQTVGGPVDGAALLSYRQLPDERTFASPDRAQTALGIVLYRLGAAPSGAAPDTVQAEISASSDSCAITTRQSFHLPAGAWLELSQFYASPTYAYAGWGDARSDTEAQVLSVGGQPAYLIQRLGWWTLDWKIGDDGLELRAPVSAISAGGLLAAAASVHSQ